MVVATGGLGIEPALAPASGAPHPPFFDGVLLTPRGSPSLSTWRLGLDGGEDTTQSEVFMAFLLMPRGLLMIFSPNN